MIKYLEKTGEINFDKIFNQRLGYLLFKDFCLNVVQEQVQAQFSLQIPFSGEDKIVNGKPSPTNPKGYCLHSKPENYIQFAEATQACQISNNLIDSLEVSVLS